MEKKDLNGQQLRNFVETHDLRNRFSIIQFNAVVSIATAMNKITNQQMEVMISFDNFNSIGQLTLMESRLDPEKYPMLFEATWQQMEHIDNKYLLISDTHKKNPSIGTYSVRVIPLGKLRD